MELPLRYNKPHIKRTPLGYPTRPEDCRKNIAFKFIFGRYVSLDKSDGVLSLTVIKT